MFHNVYTYYVFYTSHILLLLYIIIYICIPLGILRSTPDVAAWSCQCVEAHHRVRSLMTSILRAHAVQH